MCRLFLSLLLVIPASLVQAEALSVRIHGLQEPLLSHVRSYLEIYKQRGDPDLTAMKIQRLHKRAEEQISTALQVYGYYKPIIKSTLKRLDTPKGWEAEFRIDKGPPVLINILDVSVVGEGKDDPVLSQFISRFPLRQGETFEHPGYDTARDTLLRLAFERGYLDAVLTKRRVRVNLQTYQASVRIHLDTGHRYYFGPVRFHQDSMDEAFIRRFVKFKQGEPYEPLKLLNLQTVLSDAGYYQSVEVKPDKKGAKDYQVPIDVNLTPRKRREWRLGLGYATDTGARASANHSRLVGRQGNKFDSRILLAEKKNSVTLGYTLPLEDPATDQLGFGVRYTDETTDSRESQIYGVTGSHTTAWRRWQRTVSINYEQETFVIADQPEQIKRILYPAVSVTRIKADDRLRTRHGSRVFAELRGANENLLSDTNYGQLRLGLKWIRAVSRHGRVILRGDFGATNVADLDKLPASQRFFAGGDNSVRGYAYEELGPRNDAGEVIGGKHLMVGSVELEHKLAGNWNVAAFYDIGNAINSFGDELFAGAGVGVHWHSPVGPVRFDFAWALDKPQDRFRLHIVIGPDL